MKVTAAACSGVRPNWFCRTSPKAKLYPMNEPNDPDVEEGHQPRLAVFDGLGEGAGVVAHRGQVVHPGGCAHCGDNDQRDVDTEQDAGGACARRPDDEQTDQLDDRDATAEWIPPTWGC
jgi:hypothetical protein